tara:strand:- start:68726 stop:68920 length:195 start_codon:yes stop_codon:yes gene_type:complete
LLLHYDSGSFQLGLGFIFGAIIARKIGEKAKREGFELNYPLIGAAGCSGLMVWHGGFLVLLQRK